MTRKQLIAQVALHLFAEKGVEHTPTQLIAKEAEVSEALIFKHFGSKELLLDYVIRTGYKRVIEQNRGRLLENSPLELIHRIIELPLVLVREEAAFWKLQTRLGDVEVARTQHERFMQPLPGLLEVAFRQLGYAQPAQEARLLMLLVDALWKNLATNGTNELPELLEFIKSKYGSQVASKAF
ncbi:TetR/AcrR family transcriptional regulator [Hymenobacter busanensis]|uniref:TetR/AcrR family transcriptional regulator n=1 Tax=Hymenobacter busanensis TaxID=2607656 RepID=A0A7L4ZUY1_9BACT|nr:TetR/AcrR family transcriptional regulator [Hymenobacter busanensis]KAA9339227.1 TetR/AcrR family transcriptional regulator [Hymenobacter busanensis]QHJ07011.1 TetR family transcriptional regulator [Hymenobacter busanensis]